LNSTRIVQATTPSGHQLYIERRLSIDDRYYLDCSSDYKGSKHYLELPRGYKTLRGAKQAAALLIGEKLQWECVQ